jgi:hypothetical protein
LLAPTSPRLTARWSKRPPSAWSWQKLLDVGVYTSMAEISEATASGKSHVSRILRLVLLAPNMVEAILA